MAQGYLSPSVNDPLPSDYDSLIYCKTNIGGYFFDGILNIQHSRQLTITENPVETGASIVDHSYVMPAELTMTVMMSDVHRSIYPGQFEGTKSRSIAAWDILKTIQASRIPVSVFTPLGIYNNMLIQSIQATETAKTVHSLSAEVQLREIPVARIKTVKISSAPQTTGSTNLGQLEATTVSSQLTSILYQLFGNLTGG